MLSILSCDALGTKKSLGILITMPASIRTRFLPLSESLYSRFDSDSDEDENDRPGNWYCMIWWWKSNASDDNHAEID